MTDTPIHALAIPVGLALAAPASADRYPLVGQANSRLRSVIMAAHRDPTDTGSAVTTTPTTTRVTFGGGLEMLRPPVLLPARPLPGVPLLLSPLPQSPSLRSLSLRSTSQASTFPQFLL